MVESLLTQKGFEILARRVKLACGEVDLIVQKDNRVTLLEIKTLNDPWAIFQRISKSQLSRLRWNRVGLSSRWPQMQVCSFVAYVDTKSHKRPIVQFIQID